MIEVVEHALGLCGDGHVTLTVFLLEIPQVNVIFSYIKTLFK